MFRILTNRKYIGEYKFGDIVIPNAIPAIIDEETFNSVQQRIPVRVCFFDSAEGLRKVPQPFCLCRARATAAKVRFLQRHIIEKLVCLRYKYYLPERAIDTS